MKSSNLPYEPRLDHLRCAAAVLVFLFHVYHCYYLNWKPNAESPWFGLISEGHTGVSLFFVLSGFIFMTIALYNDQINYKQFMFNRVLRIAPLFLFIFFIAISLGRDGFKAYYIFYTLFSNLGEAPTSGTFITGAAWTISIEFTFYLIFPFLARFFKEEGVTYMIKLLAIVLMVKFASYYVSEESTHMYYSTLIGRIDQFLIGMVFAHLYFYYNQQFKRFGLPIFLISLLLVFGNSFLQARYFSYFLDDPNQKFWITWSFQEAFGWGWLILGYLLLPIKIPPLIDRFMNEIGRVSYSFYLLHGMVILLAHKIIGELSPFSNNYFNAFFNAVALFLIVWFVAHLSYQTIEKPFLNMRAKYVSRNGIEKSSQKHRLKTIQQV